MCDHSLVYRQPATHTNSASYPQRIRIKRLIPLEGNYRSDITLAMCHRHWYGRIKPRLCSCWNILPFTIPYPGPSGQTLTQQTSPSEEINRSWLQWSIPLQWMTSLSSNQNSTYPDAAGYCWITSRPTKASAHPVERSGTLQQRTCALWQMPNNVTYCQQLFTVQAGGGCSNCTQLITLQWNGWRDTVRKCTWQQQQTRPMVLSPTAP